NGKEKARAGAKRGLLTNEVRSQRGGSPSEDQVAGASVAHANGPVSSPRGGARDDGQAGPTIRTSEDHLNGGCLGKRVVCPGACHLLVGHLEGAYREGCRRRATQCSVAIADDGDRGNCCACREQEKRCQFPGVHGAVPCFWR